MRPSVVCWLLLLLALLAGCESAPPTTEILVVVDSDLKLGSELTALDVEIRDATGAQLLTSREFELGFERGELVLPVSFSLYPLGNAGALRLVVTGRGPGGDDVIEQQVKASFRAEQRLLLPVYLRASCLRNLCRDAAGGRSERTCVFGSCEPTPEPTLRAAGEGPLGGYDLDAGGPESPSGDKVDARPPPVEAGSAVEAGAASACTLNSDCAPRLGEVEPAGCALARCADGKCVFEAADSDGDGDRKRVCRASGVQLVLGMDCDDTNRAISSLEWDGPAGMDGAELRGNRCDELDNDCNGKVDDGQIGAATCACDPATDIDVACSLLEDGSAIEWPVGAPVGRCKAGKRSCVDGAWTACTGAVTPRSADSCSTMNDDSNCNGVLGENCQCTDGDTRACGSDLGSCKAGVQMCARGRWSSECNGAVTAAPADSCDANNDDNCNGSANDGCKCVNGSVSTCGQVLPALGDCLERAVTCTGGEWPTTTCAAQCNDCPASNPCAPGSCVDGQHTFSCECPAGTTGDGTQSCVAIDDCPAGDPCAPGTCVDGAETFSCACPSEYDGDGTQACTPKVTVCTSASIGMDAGPGVMCGPHTRCETKADGGVGCACDLGYVSKPSSDPPECMLLGLGG
jgi:hypothetical protein